MCAQASRYLLDPLNAPQPGEETGPGTSFNAVDPMPSQSTPRRSVSTSHRPRNSSGSNNPYKTYPSPPTSASPRGQQFPPSSPTDKLSSPNHRSTDSHPPSPPNQSGRPRRTSSLSARYPGDRSHRPLDIIRRDTKLANRAPHLRKTHIPGPDTIDSLDNTGFSYHHGGPYDATLLARNLSPQISPVAAVHNTNAEALRATPQEVIKDSLNRHRPLDGVAVIPPGERDISGRAMEYEEGTDMMIADGGNYKRWPGVTYLPEDLKGKGEPSFSVDRALNQRTRQDEHDAWSGGGRQRAASTSHRRAGPSAPQEEDAYEMQPPRRRASSDARGSAETADALGMAPHAKSYRQWEQESRGHSRNISAGSIGAGIKRGLGSLRRRKERG